MGARTQYARPPRQDGAQDGYTASQDSANEALLGRGGRAYARPPRQDEDQDGPKAGRKEAYLVGVGR